MSVPSTQAKGGSYPLCFGAVCFIKYLVTFRRSSKKTELTLKMEAASCSVTSAAI